MEIKPIRTKRDYEAALKEIEGLMDAKRNSPERDKLDVLVTLVGDRLRICCVRRRYSLGRH